MVGQQEASTKTTRRSSAGYLSVWVKKNQLLAIFWRQYTAPYKHSVLGAFWAFFIPVVPISAYIFLRAVVIPDRGGDGAIHGAVYVALGASIWFYMTDLVQRPNTFLIKQRAFFAFGHLSGLGVAMMAWFQTVMELGLRAPLIIAVLVIFSPVAVDGVGFALIGIVGATLGAFSIGLLLAITAALLPDLKIITEVSMRYLIFFSMAIFPLPKSGALLYMYNLNPFAVYIDNIRSLMVTGRLLEPGLFWGYVIGSVVLFFLASMLFIKLEPHLKEAYS